MIEALFHSIQMQMAQSSEPKTVFLLNGESTVDLAGGAVFTADANGMLAWAVTEDLTFGHCFTNAGPFNNLGYWTLSTEEFLDPSRKNWTFECRAKSSSTSFQKYLELRNGISPESAILYVCNYYSDQNVAAAYTAAGQVVASYQGPRVADQWYHFAVSCEFIPSGNYYCVRFFQDGVLKTTYVRSWFIAPFDRIHVAHGLETFVDEVRLSRVCRYKVNFTPPTASFELD